MLCGQLEAFCKVTVVLELNTSTLTGLTCQSDHGSIENLFSKKCQYQMSLSKDKLDDIIFELVLAQSINCFNSCFESLMDNKVGVQFSPLFWSLDTSGRLFRLLDSSEHQLGRQSVRLSIWSWEIHSPLVIIKYIFISPHSPVWYST